MNYINKEIKQNHIRIYELAKYIGETVRVCGTVHKIRTMSGFAFVILRTETALLQCVYDEKTADFSIAELKENMSFCVTGLVVADARSKVGFELQMREIEILSVPYEEPPIVISGKEVSTSLSSLLDYRPLTLRNEKERAVFVVQAALAQGIRTFLEQNRFVEIHTPKIVSGSAEGGANVFALDYFGTPAFLAQSPQFYKQTMVGVLERVYEIAPVFRAEKHDTSRHINEYTSIDLEMGFVEDFSELMQLETAMLSFAFAFVAEHCARELALLGAKVPQIDKIPAITFAEAKAMLGAPDGDDFEPTEEKRLCELIYKQTGSELVFVTHYKTSKRPFYTAENAENPSVTDSFDLLFRGMEVTTGGKRIHDYGTQVQKMRRLGMDVDAFASYLMAHKYGLPPHGGMGIGLERLTAKLLGFDNVRRATLFPRDVNRLTP